MHGDYLLFYEIREDGSVVVLRILHGARDYEAIFNVDASKVGDAE